MNDTNVIRQLVIEAARIAQRIDGRSFNNAAVEFDNWLASVKAEAWDEGHNTPHLPEFKGHQFTAVNPYREETE